MSEQNIAIIRRIIDEYLNCKNEATLYELVAPDCVIHGAYATGSGPELYKDAAERIWKAIPDYHCEIEDIFAVEDKVAIRGTEGGTHKGAFLGIPATGMRATWMAITIVRITDGKLVEVWGSRNLLEFVWKVGGTVIAGEQNT
jgi:predicted ester cyclase